MGLLFLAMIVLTFAGGIYAVLTPDPFTKIAIYLVLTLAWAGYLLNVVYEGVQGIVEALQFGSLTGTVSIVIMFGVIGALVYYASKRGNPFR